MNPVKIESQAQATPKTALVTGASRGIGFALVKELLKDNVRVIAVVRDRKSLVVLTQTYPERLQIIEADLSSPEGVLGVATSIQEPKLDYLVHNAAMIEPIGEEALLKASPVNLQKIIVTNLLAPILLTASVATKLMKGSRILNISTNTENAYTGTGMYGVSKAGLDMYTKSLQLDRPHGVLAAYVYPGEVNTGMQGDLRNHDVKEFPRAPLFHKKLEEGRLISAETSASYLKWLLLNTTDEQFVEKKHDIYDSSHHPHWLEGVLAKP
jgi:benzil reductase ((S)-benzoin forming)